MIVPPRQCRDRADWPQMPGLCWPLAGQKRRRPGVEGISGGIPPLDGTGSKRPDLAEVADLREPHWQRMGRGFRRSPKMASDQAFRLCPRQDSNLL